MAPRNTEIAADVSGGRLPYADAFRFLGIGRSKGFELVRSGKLRKVYVPGSKRPGVLKADCERLLRAGLDESNHP